MYTIHIIKLFSSCSSVLYQFNETSQKTWPRRDDLPACPSERPAGECSEAQVSAFGPVHGKHSERAGRRRTHAAEAGLEQWPPPDFRATCSGWEVGGGNRW